MFDVLGTERDLKKKKSLKLNGRKRKASSAAGESRSKSSSDHLYLGAYETSVKAGPLSLADVCATTDQPHNKS